MLLQMTLFKSIFILFLIKTLLMETERDEWIEGIVAAVNSTLAIAKSIYKQIPGSNILAKYVVDSYQNGKFF